MQPYRWEGSGAAPRALIGALSRAGFERIKSGAVIAVLYAGRAAPKDARGGPWIWIATRAVTPELRCEATLAGAYDVVTLDGQRSTRRLIQRLRELAARRLELPKGSGLIGKSPAAERVREQIALAALSAMPVMITGETGTGKDVAAHLIHQWSRRAARAFVPINCAAIPNELMEAELFGYAKGAFSGADHRFDGQLMAAAGGTVFLDEIDDTPVSTQVKLLRVLEDKIVTRIGESEPHQVDFRLLAATNRDPQALIAAGTFGQDFYERLAIVSVPLPPLRARTDDIPELVAHFIDRYYALEPERPRRVHTIAPEAIEALSAYAWPGNIRELRNVIYAALVEKRSGDELLLADLPRRILERKRPTSGALFDRARLVEQIEGETFNLRREIEGLEKAALSVALEKAGDSPARAARLLGEVGRGRSTDPGGTVRAMMRRLNL
jgi:transcriptional regulator with PAS, ATPase and Fis domain